MLSSLIFGDLKIGSRLSYTVNNNCIHLNILEKEKYIALCPNDINDVCCPLFPKKIGE